MIPSIKTSRITGPAKGTIAYEALKKIHAADRTSDAVELASLLPEQYRSSKRVKNMIESPLIKHGLAKKTPKTLIITARGRRFLRQCGIDDDVQIQNHTVQSAYSSPFRPLNFSKLMSNRPYRLGMDDYALAPSRAGSNLTPYKR